MKKLYLIDYHELDCDCIFVMDDDLDLTTQAMDYLRCLGYEREDIGDPENPNVEICVL
jgi:hypothetical protein